MSGEIVIDFKHTEGAVLRLIGLVERKGFDVTSVDMPSFGSGAARITLGVRPRDPGRRYDTLTRHVSKIYGVTGVAAEAASHIPIMERAS